METIMETVGFHTLITVYSHLKLIQNSSVTNRCLIDSVCWTSVSGTATDRTPVAPHSTLSHLPDVLGLTFLGRLATPVETRSVAASKLGCLSLFRDCVAQQTIPSDCHAHLTDIHAYVD
jgi:hypothetical protein